MSNRFKKYGSLILAFVVIVCLNYNPQFYFKTSYQHWSWNLSLLASILIILIMRYRDPIDWKQKLGINFKRHDLIGFLLSTIGLLILSYFLVEYVSRLNGYAFKPQIIYYKDYFGSNCPFYLVLANYMYFITETFNEEMLIGAVLLMGLERKFKTLDRNIIAIMIALIFSLMHQALFKWSPAQPGILLTWTTIASLFFVGILRNVLILKTRKIVFSWAIHLSFNFVFYAGFIVDPITNIFPREPEAFNIIFGNLIMLLLSGLLAVASLIWLNTNKLINSKK